MYIACLMAGKGSRLLPLTKTDHKAMLRVGGLRIIDAQLRTFTLAGFDTFSFVIGHGGVRLAKHLLTRYCNVAISLINNNDFGVKNLDWSAYLALSSRPGDVIYYEGDVIASPGILRQLATHKGEVCVVMDPTLRSSKVDTKVIMSAKRVKSLRLAEHGDLAAEESSRSEGEFVCAVKLSDRARLHVVRCLEKGPYVGPMRLYGIFNDLFKRFPAFAVNTAGRPWVEIDDKVDLVRAKKVVHSIFRRGL
jgi:choline kinase